MVNHQKDLNKELALYQSGLQASLNKELENHKRDLSKELEGYKHELQSSFQTRFYEFQTRYSWIHQKRAGAIEKVFALLAVVQNDLQMWVNSGYLSLEPTGEEYYLGARAHLQELVDFFNEKRIYFDGVTRNITRLEGAARALYSQHRQIEAAKTANPDLANKWKDEASDIMNKYIHPTMDRLENRFKQLLSAEAPD